MHVLVCDDDGKLASERLGDRDRRSHQQGAKRTHCNVDSLACRDRNGVRACANHD